VEVESDLILRFKSEKSGRKSIRSDARNVLGVMPFYFAMFFYILFAPFLLF
jgi:hypothetical protein